MVGRWLIHGKMMIMVNHRSATGLALTHGLNVEVERSAHSCHWSSGRPAVKWSTTGLPQVYHWLVVRPWKLEDQPISATGLVADPWWNSCNGQQQVCHRSTTDPWSDCGSWKINPYFCHRSSGRFFCKGTYLESILVQRVLILSIFNLTLLVSSWLYSSISFCARTFRESTCVCHCWTSVSKAWKY